MTKPAASSYPHRHLLGIEGLKETDILAFLDEADDHIAFNRQIEK